MKLQLLHENLTSHAQKELELAGLFDKNSDYAGALGDNTMEIIKVFADQGHSGFSASMMISILGKLLNYETLTPNDHSENHDVSEYVGRSCLQDTRDSKWFSYDNGKTWKRIGD